MSLNCPRCAERIATLTTERDEALAVIERTKALVLDYRRVREAANQYLRSVDIMGAFSSDVGKALDNLCRALTTFPAKEG